MADRGFIVLEGGNEFGGQMADPDRQAIMLAGGPDALISIIPAAAAPDHNHQRAGQNGVSWFQSLGATNVKSVRLIDSASADDPKIAEALARSKLSGSRSWQAILTAYQSGAVIAGSSAGAMVLCEYYYDPVKSQVIQGLNLINRICILPHHNTFGKEWVPQLKKQLADVVFVGIDEETGIINNAPERKWQVYGKGNVTLYRDDHIEKYASDQRFAIQ